MYIFWKRMLFRSWIRIWSSFGSLSYQVITVVRWTTN